MKVQDVARIVMRISGVTQKELAERHGKSGQGAIAMILQSKSMRVDSLLMILNDCGYELIARSKDGKRPEFLIGEGENERVSEPPKQAVQSETLCGEDIRNIVREVMAEELAKLKQE